MIDPKLRPLRTTISQCLSADKAEARKSKIGGAGLDDGFF
jgi:hypothetical protein